MFVNPTIAGLAKLIKEGIREEYTKIEPVEKREYYPLSSAQKRLYILQQMEFDNTSYNLPRMMELGEEIEIARIEETFRGIVKRHESLRTSFEMVSGEPMQRISEAVDLKIEYHDITAGSIEPEGIRMRVSGIIGSFVRAFELNKAPLLRVGIIRAGISRLILMVDLHHIITDGTSQQVLEREFLSIYRGDELSALRLQYKDFAGWQNRRVQQELLREQEAYWMKLFSEEIPALEIPLDNARPMIQSFAGAS
jgi:hypothetical protein